MDRGISGGAYQFRGNYTDTLPTALHLRALGFYTFIVDYRLRPYLIGAPMKAQRCGFHGERKKSFDR